MRPLMDRIFFNLNYYLFFVGYFILTRFIFLAYHSDYTADLDSLTFWMIPFKGLRLDLAAASYFTFIPILITSVSVWLKNKLTKSIITVYSYLIIFTVNILFLFDIGLYRSWGMRLDATPLMYLNTPKEMFASVPTPLLIGSIAFWIGFSVLLCFLFNRMISRKLLQLEAVKFWHAPIILLCIIPLGIAGRGGLQTIPVNQSNVYFSDKMFANHAAVNFTWSFINALSYKAYSTDNPFIEMEIDTAKSIIEAARKPLGVSIPNDSLKLFNTNRPNVILILWESLTAKVVAQLGGELNVTPNLNSLVKEGVFFDQFYSNGDRSDKGLISILSGYPPQPNKSIIKNTNKASSLPFMTKKMSELGYHNSYYYGGDLNFGNMNSYLRNGGINEFVSGEDFEKKDWNSKWGVHDHVLLNRFLSDINKEQKKPFFKILFTLTSHEPFEFPGTYAFGKDSEANLFRSAHHYTDEAIGKFIAEAKKQPWWDNSVIIIMADHGHPLPTLNGFFHAQHKFHIPMLWLGGALACKDTIISNIGSHTDFAYSFLPLIEGDNSSFEWGNNIFIKSDAHYAHYVFNKGFGVVNQHGAVLYDYHKKSNLITNNEGLNSLVDLGKALTQVTYQDYIER